MKKGSLIGIILTLWMGAGIFSCSPAADSSRSVPITIALPDLEQNALLYVAETLGSFSRNGLKIVIKDLDTGVAALQAVLEGEADIAGSAEFPFVGAALQKEPVRIIACNDRFENDYIIARRDRGIAALSDLKGKKIGVTRETINEFYLGRFLGLNGLKQQDVALVDVSPAGFMSAIASGEVDALIAWQPHVTRIQKEMGADTVVWPAQSSQAAYSILTATAEWLKDHSGAVEGFLRSLKEAEDYLIRYPEEARAMVRRRLGSDERYMAGVWAQHQFSLSLDLSLVIAMNAEARWLIENRLATEQMVPDFKEFIYLDGLKAVKPEAVNLIR